jgi:hypothetical protein
LAACTETEFTEVTWADATTALTATAATAGVPFTCTVTTTESNGDPADDQTFVKAATTTSSGPSDLNLATNWSGAAVPGAADDVYFQDCDIDCLYNLGALSAVTLTSLNILASYTGKIGLPPFTGDYYEYRATYLAVGATTINIGDGPGSGSGRLKINTGSVQTTVNVRGTASAFDGTGVYSLLWKGTHASNVVNVTRGNVGVAIYPGETATILTLRVGYQTNQDGDSTVYCGSGVTLTTINQEGGTLEINSGCTTVTKTGGTLTINSGNVTTLTNDAGTVYYKGTGTITTLNVGSGAKADFSQDMRARTVTTCNLYEGGEIYDPFGTVTFTNGIVLIRCGLPDVKINVGNNRTVAIT